MSQVDSPWEVGGTGTARSLQSCLRNSRRKFINDPQGPPVSPARSRSLVLGFSHEVANCNLNFAPTIFAGHGLCRSAPAAIQQDACRRHARGWWHGFLADDPGEHLDAELGVPPRQRPQIGRYFLSGQRFTGWAYPLLLAQAFRARRGGNRRIT
jgi:hypothetical protein